MNVYIIKVDGHKVRSFTGKSYDYVLKWAKLYCHSDDVVIMRMTEGEMPKAIKLRFNPDMDMPELTYKAFSTL